MKKTTINFVRRLQFEDVIAPITVVLVAVVSLMQLYARSSAVTFSIGCGLFLLYLISVLVATIQTNEPQRPFIGLAALALMLVSAFALLAILPFVYLSILLIIWVAILPFYFGLLVTSTCTLLAVCLWFGFFAWRWQVEDIWITALLYGTFHIFAVFMSYQTQKAKANAEESQRLHQQLDATQHLLAQASKQSERTRIARDLHDLLGHHLTALIIKLQVASHKTDGEAKVQIDECHQLAKLLLSDVREAVSSLRESNTLPLADSIQLMLASIPSLKCQLHMPDELEIEHLAQANTLLFMVQEALTNSMRHSQGSNFEVEISQTAEQISMHISDNGGSIKDQEIVLGNGLIGMRERINDQRGTLALKVVDGSLHLHMSLPHSPKERA